MVRGTLEVILVDAYCNIRDGTNPITKMDPVVLIQYGNEEQKSRVAHGGGRNPVWNQKFDFSVEFYPHMNSSSSDKYQNISLRIMDKDTLANDDFVGESKIYVVDLISLGKENGASESKRTKYNVLLPDKTCYGDIQVALKFTVENSRLNSNRKQTERKQERFSRSDSFIEASSSIFESILSLAAPDE